MYVWVAGAGVVVPKIKVLVRLSIGTVCSYLAPVLGCAAIRSAARREIVRVTSENVTWNSLTDFQADHTPADLRPLVEHFHIRDFIRPLVELECHTTVQSLVRRGFYQKTDGFLTDLAGCLLWGRLLKAQYDAPRPVGPSGAIVGEAAYSDIAQRRRERLLPAKAGGEPVNPS